MKEGIRMYRIMVADDEPKTRNGLCRFLAESGLPVSVCAQAGDGEEALRLLLEQRPDIVLLDICMPHMDGLEFLSEAKQLGIGAKFIILTGFDEFSFAKQSVALHAYAYLLKPVDEDELTACLRQAFAELETERTQDETRSLVVTQVENNRNLLRSAFLTSWMDGTLTGEAWRESAAFWGLDWPSPAWLTLLKPDFDRSGVVYNQDKAPMLFGACNIAEELLESRGVRCSARHDRDYAMIITASAPQEGELDKISDVILRHLQLPCQLACGKLAKPEDVPAAIVSLLAEISENLQFSPLVQRIRLYLEAHYQDPELSLSDLARELAVSKPHLARLIRSAFSTSYIGYLTGIRMRRAIDLMAVPANKLSWIAVEVGYSDLHYFSYAFKKYTGLSPSAYREKTYGT
jgi:two-component system response regulator YesN